MGLAKIKYFLKLSSGGWFSQSLQYKKFLPIVAFAFLLQSCVVDNALETSKEPSPSLTSRWVKPNDPQEEIGASEHPLVVAKFGGEYKNQKVETILALIVGRLVDVSQDKGRIYKVTILNSPKVNAFALPGGFLYVTRGLLALANDSAELAAVLSHEMAHVSANHAILRRDKQSSTNVGQEVANEILGDSVAGRVAVAANQLRLSDFSKDQELQADAIGIRMLGNAGFDAHGAARFLETMQLFQSLNDSGSDKFQNDAFLSSHPATPKRIALAKKHARFFGAPGVGETGRDRYLRGIDNILFGDSADEGFLRGNRFSHVGLGITFSAPQNTRLENQSTSVIVSGPGTIATRFDAAVIGGGQSLADYLKSGWVKGLDETTIVEGQTNGLPSATARAKGENWDFVINVIQIEKQVYRFITAGPMNDPKIVRTSSEITNSFRKMNQAERDALKPLRVKVITVSQSDNLGSLSAKMQTGKNKLKLFQALNGLGPGEVPTTGNRVKIISE